MKQNTWIFMALFGAYLLLISYLVFCFSQQAFIWINGLTDRPDPIILFGIDMAVIAVSAVAFYMTYFKSGEGTKILICLVIALVAMACYFSTLPKGGFGSFFCTLAALMTGFFVLKRLFAIQDKIALVFAVGLVADCYLVYLAYMVSLLS